MGVGEGGKREKVEWREGLYNCRKKGGWGRKERKFSKGKDSSFAELKWGWSQIGFKG